MGVAAQKRAAREEWPSVPRGSSVWKRCWLTSRLGVKGGRGTEIEGRKWREGRGEVCYKSIGAEITWEPLPTDERGPRMGILIKISEMLKRLI